jgi:hypothetical protein
VGIPAVGEIVLVPFPFSDLSDAKKRPAICLAFVGRGDWTLCQITSNAYGDPHAIPLDSRFLVRRLVDVELRPTWKTIYHTRLAYCASSWQAA